MRRLLPALLLTACFAEEPDRDPFGEGGQDAAGDEESSSEDGGGSSSEAGSEATGEPLAGLHEPCSENSDCEGASDCWGQLCANPYQYEGVQCVADTCTAYTGGGPNSPTADCPDGEVGLRAVDPASAGWAVTVCAIEAEIVDGLARCDEGMAPVVWSDPDAGMVATCWWAELKSGAVCDNGDYQDAINSEMLPRVCS